MLVGHVPGETTLRPFLQSSLCRLLSGLVEVTRQGQELPAKFCHS